MAVPAHHEQHKSHRSPWLRAAVLGAMDGVVSTSALVLGVAAAASSPEAVFTAGLAGLVAGALSMAAGEYVSVSSQRDAERADLALEKRELEKNPERELEELVEIYMDRGLDRSLAREVAEQLSEGDRLEVHAREELNLDLDGLADPWQAAWTSAVSFSVGGALPVAVITLPPEAWQIPATVASALVVLAGLGSVASWLGGATWWKGALRVVVGGALAMAVTMVVGRLFGGPAA